MLSSIFFGKEGDFVLAVGFFFLPACFVVEAFLRFQVRVSDDVADAARLLAGVHLAEGRKDEGLSYAGVEALRIVQFVQVLCLAAEVVEVLDAAGGPCAAAAQGQDVLGREISFPGSEGGDDVASGIARFIFKGFPDEGCADQEGLVRISIPYFLHVVAVGLVLFPGRVRPSAPRISCRLRNSNRCRGSSVCCNCRRRGR